MPSKMKVLEYSGVQQGEVRQLGLYPLMHPVGATKLEPTPKGTHPMVPQGIDV